MMLFDYEDVKHLKFNEGLFYKRWTPGDPEAIACDYADVIEGPFLLLVHNEAAFMSHGDGRWTEIARNPHFWDRDKWGRWSALAKMYAESGGLSVRNLTFRIFGMTTALKKKEPGVWTPWDKAYRWNDGEQLIWDCLNVPGHPHYSLKCRVNDEGVREVRHGK